MSYEINDGRTPPTMMFSMSPNYDNELSFPQQSVQGTPVVLNSERFKDVSNLKINQRRSRSFTPVKGSLYMRSPELSPIDVTNNRQLTPEVNNGAVGNESLTPGQSHTLGQSLTPGQFKIPQPMTKTIKNNTTPTGPPNQRHQNEQENILGTPSAAEDPNQTQSLDKSASHGYLNHNLDVRLILKNAGMHQYIKAFNKEKINFEKFLALCDEDLLRLGVKRKMDRKIISCLINDLNAN